jgi:hypothetical protein
MIGEKAKSKDINTITADSMNPLQALDYIPQSKILINIFKLKINLWQEHFPDNEITNITNNSFLDIALQIHFGNYYQWIREAKVRIENQSIEIISKVKKEIDFSNERRNELIGNYDHLCLQHLKIIEKEEFSDYFLNSETPGQMVDRLSILLLKIFFMKKCATSSEVNNDIKCKATENIIALEKQFNYLSICYDKFVNNLISCDAYMCPYKQIKLYSLEDLKE